MSGAINANVIGNAVGEALFGITAENLREIQREKNLNHVTQFLKGSGTEVDFDEFIKSFQLRSAIFNIRAKFNATSFETKYTITRINLLDKMSENYNE